MAEPVDIRHQRHKVRTLEGDRNKTSALRKRLAAARLLLTKLIESRRSVKDYPDVSAYQAPTDFRRLRRSGVRTVGIKATEGVTYEDKPFRSSWRDAGRAGLARQPYHYAHPGRNGARAEADHFVDTLKAAGGLAPGDRRPTLDV